MHASPAALSTDPECGPLTTPNAHRAGFVALLGKPNAGKSTLLNRLVGVGIAAVSPLPQTTRDRFLGILSEETRQFLFVDLPGMVAGNDRLNQCLRRNVLEGMEGIDVVLHLVDVGDTNPLNADVEEALRVVRSPIILVLTKVDGKRAKVDVASWAGENLPERVRNSYKSMIAISSLHDKGLGELLDSIASHLPESPPLYDPDDVTDRDLRYLSQEMIREKLFLHLNDELPYATAVQVDEFRERETGKWYIRATIHVERISQKGIVIGKGGATLKKIAQDARREIERICDFPVFLDLWVKVTENWRRNDGALREFGLKPPPRK
jgi:GTPase